MNLSEDFCIRINDILGNTAEDYFKALELPHFRGLRVNTLKTDIETLKKHFLFLNEPSLFCSKSFYIPSEIQKFGNSPFHHAGAFYLQEPSASSAVTALAPKQYDRVLDLCAAPGGKTTQIAAELGGTGIVWANEFVGSRTAPLISNIERLGITNAIVSSSRPDILCEKLESFFDKVLVDAPCSGEGMIRKEPSALENWSVENINSCAMRQQKILESAKIALRPGGMLCYSTCTFAPEENEMVIAKFLKNNPQFSLQKIDKQFGISGIKKFAPDTENIEFCRRIFPQNGGEGHFVALLKLEGDELAIQVDIKQSKTIETEIFECFYAQNFDDNIEGVVVNYGDRVYITPSIPLVKNAGIIRSGLFCGQVTKGRFEPAHALFTAVGIRAKQVIDLPYDDKRLNQFLHGEQIPCNEALKGYVAVKVCSIPLGFGKASGGVLKNHYPKGLRIM
ncbi:MAG: RsmB/NOP family class I SAM-dependent RNA methyltransferase [Oscillospiraceae bacterium]|nr:RsmB/NOP family class I SAM-dependent RNA methyltransferase [Oscillospiraceae bacterium]